MAIKFKSLTPGGVELQLNLENGVLSLLDDEGKVISSVDFPTEKILTNASYDEATEELVLEFESADTIRIPIIINMDNYVSADDFEDEVKRIADAQGYIKTCTDTKNSAGSSNSTSKLYLIGAANQTATGTTTYSNSSCYMRNGYLYSNGSQVALSYQIPSSLSSLSNDMGFITMVEIENNYYNKSYVDNKFNEYNRIIEDMSRRIATLEQGGGTGTNGGTTVVTVNTDPVVASYYGDGEGEVNDAEILESYYGEGE